MIKNSHLSEKSKRKLSETWKQKYRNGYTNPNFGRKVSEEQKLKQSNALKGRKISKESIEKMIKTRKERYEGKPSPLLGRPRPEEVRKRISKKHKGMKHTEETKKKMSRLFKGRPAWNKGLTKSDLRVAKYSSKLEGKKRPEETNIKIKESWLKKVKSGWTSPMKGKTLEEIYSLEKVKEIKEKIRKGRAEQLIPVKDTSIEKKIQSFCKELSISFISHKFINIPHCYQCDLFLPDHNLIIECDGYYWHSFPEVIERDTIRTKEMIELGYKVLRLPEEEIEKLDKQKFKDLVFKEVLS